MSISPQFHRPPGNRVHQRAGSRRDFLRQTGAGLGALAFADLLVGENLRAAGGAGIAGPVGEGATRGLHFPGRAKAVIWLFMEGGPSAMDTFDPKPELDKHDGEKPSMGIDVFFGNPGPLMKSPFSFRQHGQSGTWVCDAMPHIARHVDDLALIKSCQAESPSHGPAMYQINTGVIRAGLPSAGAWVTYGLGSVNRNLPGFVVLQNSRGSKGGAGNWGAGFLPSDFQATAFRSQGSPVLNLTRPGDLSERRQRQMLELARGLNEEHAARHPEEEYLRARMQSYELAFNMQTEATEAVDLAAESPDLRELYGLNNKVTRPFGEKCLLARRLVERGVRFVQVYCDDEWDSHDRLAENHGRRMAETDQPVAALLSDLKQRGLLDETLVVWGGEFGRMPVSQRSDNPRNDGRDHNPYGFLTWMAGGGVRGGIHYGATDEIGWKASVNPVSVHDLHATILHTLGIDHERLTYFHNGRHFRLTDVAGNVLRSVVG